MSKIRTIGELKKQIESLPDDFKIELRIRKRLSEEELEGMVYPYPYDTDYFEGFEYGDTGWSDKIWCIGVTTGDLNE